MDLLSPYVPRLLLEWGQSQPAEAWREVDATMVFVDVSGFTAMSERLARRGKVGAEEVMAVISTTFEQLLEVAYGVGGGLLKFGGDSLLLFFSGESHAARGCFAAAGMRRTLRTAGRITTSAGKVTLRMSAGVHSGTFHLFLAGNSHRELVVTGPGASATVRAESGASAGEILLSAGAVRAADPRLLGEPREGGRLLGKVPEAPPPVPAPPVSGESVARVFVPQAIRRHIEGGGAEAEHRTVALAFVKFSGIDTLIASEGPAEVAGRLDQLVTCAQEAADDHEITFLYTDIDSDGGKVLICSGAPRTFDNNEERVLRAVRRVMDSGVPLALRAGIHRGHAFTGDVGPPYRRTYTAMGDVVNTAARVMSHAAPSEILATREALDCSAAEFEAAQTEPFRVKGKSEPLVAWRVGKLAGLRRRQEDAPSPLVGREPEMAPLLWALQSAREGTGGSLAVIGEAGVGKSRLVQELQAGAEGVRTLSVSAEQYQRSTPYHCFGRLLAAALDLDARNPEALTERTSALAPELLPWLPLAALVLDVPVEQTPEVRRLDDASRAARLRQVVVELMQAALPGPSLLVIEDAQWLDEASRELLRHVEAQSGRPWLFVVAGRSAAEAAGRTTVKVGPLPHADAAALARSAAQGRLLPAASAALAERSGGNPLFLLELVAASEPGAEALPDSVEALIASRIDLLPPRDRTLLRTLSVLGASFDAKLLSTLGDEVGEPSWRRLQGFVRRRGGTFTFTQALFQQVAYEGLP
ncbi:MAG TPA: adenylate/guanylate cyclase domain-containing protein, partial [Actinomycetota bacterium]|nr:adenylate/guanylate cyclase domain-containing protein [Actinomycetota bacterium]